MKRAYQHCSDPDKNTVSPDSFPLFARMVYSFIQPLKLYAFILISIGSSLFVKAAPWPTIKLIATVNLENSYTIIAFNKAMTNGLDQTYDAALLGGGSDLLVYSFLLQDYPDVKIAIQALPDYGYSTITIPIGLDFKTGGTVVFSAELSNLRAGYKVLFEDKVTSTITDLSNSTYSVSIPANSSITTRFQLHYTPSATSWNGTMSNDWNIASNWSTGIVPTALDDVIISTPTNTPVVNQAPGLPAMCNNLLIESGGALTIAAGKALTVNGVLTNNSTGGIITRSDASGTGSLITGSTTGAGTAIAERYMTTGAWHIVSSPLAGEDVSTFLTANSIVPLKNGNRGMMDYNPVLNNWNFFFTNSTNGIPFGSGKGFSVRSDVDGTVQFAGSLQAGPQSASALAGYWNCIGNPYTSAIRINTNGSNSSDFLTANATNFDSSYGAIYIWNKPDAFNGQTGNYTVISNTSPTFDVQQGQAFMVNMSAGGTMVNFTPQMQTHDPGLELKSAKNPWPTINLVATFNSEKSSTMIAFNPGMTKGLDPTYDAGLLKGASDLVVYSRLVEDNGIPFAIQALPLNEFNSLVIPVGIDFKTGGDVVFSVDLLNLPFNCTPVLEDKLKNTFTDLSKNNYKVTIPAASVISDRFFLHTSPQTISKSGSEISQDRISVFANRNIEIRVVGDVSDHAFATLYDVQGRVVLIENLKVGSLNVISTSYVKSGIYLLTLRDKGSVKSFKLVIRE